MRREAALLGLLLACGEETPTDVLPDSPAPDASVPEVVDAGPSIDLTEAFFDDDRLLEIEIDLAPADWDELRNQSRGDFVSLLGGDDCLSEPFVSPYTYFPATVTVDGEPVENVGVRKKGFIGSASSTKPSLKIKFDEFVPDQRHGGLIRMTLNNSRQDPAYVKQCLSYHTFTKAGLAAPRCNFAHVTVNGQDLGIFVHIDAIKKPFLRRHFTSEYGNLYEGTLADFRDGWMANLERKNNAIDPDTSDLVAIKDAAAVSDAELATALSAVIDLDHFFSFWALEVLVGHWDGYAGNTNNYYFYNEPSTGLFTFIPWGTDGTFGNRENMDPNMPKAVLAQGVLAHRLYAIPEQRMTYIERLREMLDVAWSEDEMLAYVDASAALITPSLPPEEVTRFNEELGPVRDFISGRRSTLLAELDMGGRDWPLPLRETLCLRAIGNVSAELTTTFGSHPSQNPLMSGSGTFVATIDGSGTYTGQQVGGAAGMGVGPEDMNEVVLIVVALLPGNAVGVVYVALQPELLVPGAVLNLGFGPDQRTRGFLLYAPQVGAELVPVGFLAGGSVTVLDADTVFGAPVQVLVETPIYNF